MTKNVTFDDGVYDDSLAPFPPVFGRLTNTAELTGQTGAVASLINFTTPNDARHLYVVYIVITVTAWTAGTFNPELSWTDDNGTTHTGVAIPVGVAGSAPTVTAIGATGTYMGSMPFATQKNVGVTLLTGGTFTTLTYNISGSIAQLR